MNHTTDARLLVLNPIAAGWGAERSLVGLLRYLPRMGVEPFTVVLVDGALVGMLERLGVPHRQLPPGRLRDPRRVRQTIREIRALAVEQGSELVFSNSAHGHIYGGVDARGLGVPAVW